METIQDVSRAISALQTLSEENPEVFSAHYNDIKRLYNSFKSLLGSSNHITRVQEQTLPDQAIRQRDEKAAYSVMRYLSKRTHEIETFSKKKVSDIIISDRKSEDFRVRDGKQAVANNSMEVRFRAGLGVSSLAEDFLKYSDEICQHSKLDEMLLNSKKGSSYQQYTEICPHFTDKRGAALLIGIGIKFKFLERILKTKLQELSVNTELSDSLPLSYVWITFFAWSYIPRCSPNALQVIAQNLISGEVWKNLAASARSWRDECSETYRSLCFSCSPAYGFARSSSSSGSSAIDGAIFSQCSQPSLEAPDTDGAAASTSPSSSSEILGPENVVEKPVSVPTLVNPLPPSSLSETSNSADVVSSPNPPLTTKRRLSSGAIPIPSKHQRTMDHEPDDDVYTNATVPELHSISDSDPFGPDMEHTVLASIAQGVSIPTVTLSPYNPNPDIDIWNCPIFSETLLSDESSRVPSSPAILDVDIWNIPVFSEGFEPGDDVIPDNPLISSINPPGENVDSWDDPMAHTSTQDRNDNVYIPPASPTISSCTNIDIWNHPMISASLSGSDHSTYQTPALQASSSRTEIDIWNDPTFFTGTRDGYNDAYSSGLFPESSSSTGINIWEHPVIMSGLQDGDDSSYGHLADRLNIPAT